MLIDKIKIISKLFSEFSLDLNFEHNNFIIVNNIDSHKQKLSENSVPFEELAGKLHLKISQFLEIPLIYYPQPEKYLYPENLLSNFIILALNGNYCLFHNEKITYDDKCDSIFQITCSNLISYYQLFNFLKSESFSDHFNDANQEIVIYNSATGIFKIEYDLLPILNWTSDISSRVIQIIEFAKQVSLSAYFKNALYEVSKKSGAISINEIINNHQNIISIGKRDYELATKQFNFDNFKDSLFKEKEKYFTSTRELINKIFSYSIGIPISISAAIYSTYKISGEPILLSLVLLAFIVYIVFYTIVQSFYLKDINELKSDFNSDFEMIKLKSGLDETVINREKIKIETKISDTKVVIEAMIFTIIVLGLLVVSYIGFQILEPLADIEKNLPLGFKLFIKLFFS